jgi:hypothetical protein
MHLVPAELELLDELTELTDLTAWLTAQAVPGGWQVGVIIKKRNDELQTPPQFSRLLLRLSDPSSAMLSIRLVSLYDGVDNIIARFTYRGQDFETLFTAENLRGLISQPFVEPLEEVVLLRQRRHPRGHFYS